MKKIRLALTIAAIAIAGVLAVAQPAFASDPPCVYSQQYYKVGFSYFPTGQMGLHYACIVRPVACTYYLPNPVLEPENFYPCRQGEYVCLWC